MLESALLLGLSTTFNSLTNLYTSAKAREQAALFQQQNRHDAMFRFNHDLDFRKAQFLFSKQNAEQVMIQRIKERDEDIFRQDRRERMHRAFTHLNNALYGSPDGVWQNDPYAASAGGIKSLRVLFFKPKGMTEGFQNDIEHSIGEGIEKYTSKEIDYPIHFPTGAWKESSSNGSWISSELHAWDPTIPTLILRVQTSGKGSLRIKADIFGFQIGNWNFKPNLMFGEVANDPDQLAKVLPVLTLAAADVYYFYTYGKKPLLPSIISDYLVEGGGMQTAIFDKIIDSYATTVHEIVQVSPDVGIYAALNLAESCMAIPDKRYVIDQLRQIESSTKSLWSKYPELVQRLKQLYHLAGKPEEADRITELPTSQQDTPLPNLLKIYI